ncbi:MAG: helix-turn-helix transcriptional regulator [Polyangiales bacterium]
MEPEQPGDVLRDLGRRIAELRAQNGQTQEQLSEKLNVSLQYLQRIEMGRENLTVRSLTRLAEALAVPLKDLFVEPQNREVRIGRPPARERP